MTLVGSSVWIDFLLGLRTPEVDSLRRLLRQGEVALAAVIVQELLQGARSEAALAKLRQRLLELPLLATDLSTYVAAGELYARCRWQGITRRSSHDCLIATLAVTHEVERLAADRDFAVNGRVLPALRPVRADD
ncbi:MAG: PIN domain-containing protein [Wenzhouxiangellaceae bacterium]|nr:PIN domain-containing protein [Wenzhouxiangellaceae bacterium]